MAVVGYATLPIIPSLQGVSKALSAQLEKPAAASSKRAGESIEQQMKAAIESATWAAEKAAEREKAAQEVVTAATHKRTEALNAVKNKTEEIALLETRLESVRTQQDAKVAVAEEAWNKARQDSATTTEQLTKLETNLKLARDAQEIAVGRADLTLTKAREDLEKKTRQAGEAEEKLADAQHDAATASDKAKTQAAKLEHQQSMTTKEFQEAQKELDDLNRALGETGSAMDTAGEKSRGFGGKLMAGLGTIGRGALLGVGAKVSTTIMDGFSTAMSKGMSRLQSIEQAETMLQGLGHSAESTAGILDNAMASVKGTAFGFGEAASMAATFVGDSAAIAGADFQEMGSIWTKIASGQRMSTEELNQLMDRGLGLLPKLQEKYGVTADEARKMITEGKVSFEDFADVMENMVGGSAQAMGQTFSGSYDNMQAALGRFGAQLLAPVFSNAPTIFAAVTDAVDKLGEKITPLVEKWAEKLQPHFERFAEWLGPALESAIDGIASKLSGMVTWVQDNEKALKPLVVMVGAAATAFTAWKAATAAWSAVTTIATKVQKAFTLALSINPVMALVMALAAVTAGAIYFFTQTERGQKAWQTFTETLSESWAYTVEKVKDGWAWFTDNFFISWDEAVAGIKDSWTYTLDTISSWWTTIKDGMIGVWTQLKEGVHDSFERANQRLSDKWNEITTAVSTAWTGLKDNLLAVWETVKTGLFDAWDWYASRVRANWDLITTAMTTAWSWLKDQMLTIWTFIRDTIFNAWNITVGNVKATFELVTGALSTSWTWLKDRLYETWSWIDTNIFTKFRSTLDTLKAAFETTVENIRIAWDKIRAATARPVKFVIETVYGGIKKAWDGLANLIGVAELPNVPIGDLGNYAAGGRPMDRLPGYQPGVDRWRFYEPTTGMSIGLGPGEGISRPEVVRAIGPDQFDGLNAAGRIGGVEGARRYLANMSLGNFNTGGIIGSITRLVNKHFPGMTITSTMRPGDPGYHGRGMAVDFSDGTDTTPGMQAAARFFYQNYGPGLAELIHWPLKGWQNIKHGAPLNYGQPTNNQHRNHVHIAATSPLGAPGDPDFVFQGGGGGFFESMATWAKRQWDKVVSGIGAWDGPGLIGEMPGAFMKKATDSAWSFLKEKFSALGFWGGGSGEGAEEWRDMAVAAMRRNGFNADDPRQVDAMLRQIMSESGGNPSIAQQIVDVNGTGEAAGVGLLQIIPGTFAAHRDPELPNDRRDPWANMNAALRYYKSRYGMDLTTMWGHGHGYHNGGLAPAGQGFLEKTAMEPEMVLSPRMTEAFLDWMKVARELAEAFRGGDWGYGELADRLGDERLAKQLIDHVAMIGEHMRPMLTILEEQLRITPEQRRASLADHLAGVTTSDDGTREQTRGRIGTPEEIARWAGESIAEELGNEALGLIGLDGLLRLPRTLDDELRVPFTKTDNQESTTTAAAEQTVAVEPKSVADQAAPPASGDVTINVTFNNVDPKDTDELRRMVDEIADKVNEVTNGRRTAAAVSRGASI